MKKIFLFILSLALLKIANSQNIVGDPVYLPNLSAITSGTDSILVLDAQRKLKKISKANFITDLALSGGSGTPASPANSVQFNNAGAFGGSSNFVWVDANNNVQIAGVGSSSENMTLTHNLGTLSADFIKMSDNNSSGFINIGDAASTGFFPYIQMRSDGTSQNSTAILINTNNSGSTAALQLRAQNLAGSGVLGTQPLFDFQNFTNSVLKINADNTIGLSGTSSGVITLTPQAAAGTYSWNWPTTAGTTGYFLTANTTGAMTWTDPAGLGGSATHYKTQVTVATAAVLPACTYNNGTSGVGATLTGNSNGVLVVDGHTMLTGETVLVKDQVSGLQNGIYDCGTPGNGGVAFVLTRRADFDQSADIATGDAVLSVSGSTTAGTIWYYNGASSPTMGTTALTFVEINNNATVADNSITNAKLAQMAAGTYKANITGSTANASDVTRSNVITDLSILQDPGSNGILSRTAANTVTQRTITGTTNEIDVSAGDGVSGNPVLSLPSTIAISGILNTGTLTVPTASGTLIQYTNVSAGSSATWSPSGDNKENNFGVPSQTVAVTTVSAPTGSPANFSTLTFQVKCDATPRAISGWNAIYRASTNLALPTTLTASKTMYIKFIYNSIDTKWDLVSVLDGF